jgi:hypothetical protein
MKEQSNKKSCIYFHQGWTDIIMCLSLITYYRKKYDEIYVIIRSDAKELLDFYVREKEGVHIIYINTDNGRFYGNINTQGNSNNVFYDGTNIEIPNDFEIMFHAEHDIHRKDKYRGYWNQPESLKKKCNHFSEMFYTFYDIDFNVRIDEFTLKRDYVLEEKKYKEFIEKYGKDYVIYHDDELNNLNGFHHVSTKIEFENMNKDYNYVNINKQSKIFFDYIKIFQESKEIHLVDSIWACLIYQLDAKYNILENKEVNVYCKRGHNNLFEYPIKLSNWKLK